MASTDRASAPAGRWRHFSNWPLRAKLVWLLVLATMVPLAFEAVRELRETRAQRVAVEASLLAARADQLVGEIDAFNRGYEQSAKRVALLPEVGEFCARSGTPADPLASRTRASLAAWPGSAEEIRGVALLDPSGTVVLSTDRGLEGNSLTSRRWVNEALLGHSGVSEVYLAEPEVARAPTIAYFTAVRRADGGFLGVAVIWVRASSLWELTKTSNALAGPDSFAVLLDGEGIRIAHTYSDELVFHPAGNLDGPVVDNAVAEERFGEHTREMLDDVRAFPEAFVRARSPAPDPGVFIGTLPGTQPVSFCIGRRLTTVPWTVFYMIPQESLEAPIRQLEKEKVGFALLITVLTLVAGLLVARVLLRPIRDLAGATESLAKLDLSARVVPAGTDEIGRLGASFNAMAARIEDQDATLREARGQLEARVVRRTAELLASEHWLRITLDSIGDGVIATDAEGHVVRMNPVAERLTGWAQDEAVGIGVDDVFRLVDEDTEAAIDGPVGRVLHNGSTTGLSKRTALVARDGTMRPIGDSSAPIRDPGGKLHGVVVVFRDQTAARAAEKALRESESRKAAVMESALDGIVVMDHEGKILEWNPAAETTFGHTKAAVMGKLVGDVMVPASLRGAHRRGLARYLATGEKRILGRRVEVTSVRADGAEFPAEVAITRIEGDGLPVFTGYVRDITERKRIEVALRASEVRFRCLYESGVIAIVTFDLAGNILDANDTYLRLLGYSREDFVSSGLKSRAITPPEWSSSDEGAFRDLARDGLSPLREKEYVRRDGTRVPVLVAGAVLDVDSDRCIGFIVDLTERKAAEAAIDRLRSERGALEEQNRQVIAASQLKSAFLANMSHELRTPLNAIIGFSQLLANGFARNDPAQHDEFLGDILTSGKYLLGLIDDLLDLARIESGKIELEPEAIDLALLAAEVVAVLRPQFESKQLKAECRIDPGLTDIFLDSSRLRQVLFNYLSNAIKFSPEGGTIVLRAMPEGETAFRLEVEDRGNGIAESDLPRLFAEFVQLDAGLGKHHGGTGLGLAITKTLVEAQGGRVGVRSALGKGTTFHAVLFCRQPDVPDARVDDTG